MPRLTPAEKQDVIRFLEADRPLPDKYRFLLFDDKLVWNGKTAEVCKPRPFFTRWSLPCGAWATYQGLAGSE
jgi:hypothetical protein